MRRVDDDVVVKVFKPKPSLREATTLYYHVSAQRAGDEDTHHGKDLCGDLSLRASASDVYKLERGTVCEEIGDADLRREFLVVVAALATEALRLASTVRSHGNRVSM